MPRGRRRVDRPCLGRASAAGRRLARPRSTCRISTAPRPTTSPALQRLSPCCNPAHLAGGSPRQTSIAIIGTNKPDANDLLTFAKTYGLAMKLTQHQINGPACCDGEMTADIETATAMANSFGSSADTAHIYAYEGGWEEAHRICSTPGRQRTAPTRRASRARASERPRAAMAGSRTQASPTSARSSTR